jgi:hypothetical protein
MTIGLEGQRTAAIDPIVIVVIKRAAS